MPTTLHALKEQLASNNSNNLALQRILMRDPAATIALYDLVEQVRPGTAKDIADPAHALSLIGQQAFADMLGTLPTADRHDSGHSRPHIRSAYSQAAHTAWFARSLAKAQRLDKSEEIASAALLQHPAILLFWLQDNKSAARATNAVRCGVPFDVAFSAELGESLQQANRRLAEAWNLPQLACESMGNWNPFNRAAQTVALADMLTQTAFAGWPPESLKLNAEILEEFLGQSHDAVSAWWRQGAAEAAREMTKHDYPLPAFELLLIPGGEQEPEVPPLPAQGQQAAETSAKTPRKALQEFVSSLMRRVQKEVGITRAVFGMPNRERTEIKARLALGGNQQDPMRQFTINLRQRNLFSALLNKQQSVWLHPGNRSKYTALLKGLPLDGGSTQGFFAMSIFIQGKPLGLLYADGGTLDEKHYRHFRKLCSDAAQTLAVN